MFTGFDTLNVLDIVLLWGVGLSESVATTVIVWLVLDTDDVSQRYFQPVFADPSELQPA